MPVIDTRRFGRLEYEDSWIVNFPLGLPGFEKEKAFALLERADWSPIVFLQSLTDKALCFPAAPVSVLDPEYSLQVTAEDLQTLRLDRNQPVPGAQVLCLALLCAPENGPLTANLLAPVVVNVKKRLAVQAVRTDARYSHQHAIGTEAACS